MGERLRLLLVEDDAVDRMAFEQFVEREGLPYDCRGAASISEAREVLTTERFDVVLMDYLLGDGTAFDLLDAVGETPSLVITGVGEETVAVEAMKRGVYGYLVKDPKGSYPTTLPILVEHTLERWRAKRELAHYHAHLEEMVAERTAELVATGEELRAEINRRWQAQADMARASEALRESEARYRLHFENVSDIIYSLDPELKLIDISPSVERVLGYKPEELIGRSFQELNVLAPAYLEQAFSDTMRVLRGERIPSAVYQFIARDGTRKWGEVSGAPLVRDGQVVALVSVARDITERKQAEEALRESEEKFRTISEQSLMGILIAQSNRIEYINQTYADVFGYSVEEMLEWQFEDAVKAIHPEDRVFALEQLEKKLAGSKDTVIHYQYRGIKKSGETIWIDNFSRPIVYKGGSANLVTIVDITERKRAEEERECLAAQVREQARQMEQILATVPAGVLLLDAEGRLLQANPTAEEDLAILADVQVGEVLTHLGDRPLADLLTSPPTRGLWHEIKADNRTFEVIARPVEPALGPTADSQLPNGNQPEPEHWVLVINDVTREREVQAQLQQQERLAAVGQLAAGIAHDFNNIMATIVLYAQMTAQSRELSEHDRERMAVINQQAHYASRLIQQILDFSRRAMLERRPLDLLPLLKEQVKLLERTLPEHIRVELSYGRDEYTVDADPTRMQQMLTNLAVNARDAMPQGGTLRVELERTTVERGKSPLPPEMGAGQWIRLTVSDTGTGIPPDVLPHIFEPFFSTKAPGEGNGLGLAQVYGIVGQHGGHVDVRTQMGEGTTFTIYLPALEVRLTEPLLLDVSVAPQGQGELVLVVEDGKTVRAALVESLEQLNYQTLEAANGEQALAVLEEQGEQIALVLSDVVMPVMGGVALFHALREKGWQMPVILLTGHPMDKELDKLRAQGLSAWLPKPPSLERLAQAVADALRE